MWKYIPNHMLKHGHRMAERNSGAKRRADPPANTVAELGYTATINMVNPVKNRSTVIFFQSIHQSV